jgi:hypothetical protein
VEPGLLRAQSASAVLSPGDHADESPSRAQSLFIEIVIQGDYQKDV